MLLRSKTPFINFAKLGAKITVDQGNLLEWDDGSKFELGINNGNPRQCIKFACSGHISEKMMYGEF